VESNTEEGQVEAHARLRTRAPENAEFYVVVQGSRLTHVTTAKRVDDGLSLCFTVPGHDLVEVVSVTCCLYIQDQVEPREGEASLEYLSDVAQEAAEYLSANREQLGPQSYLEVLKRFPMLMQSANEELCAGQLGHNEQEVQLGRSSGDDVDVRLLDEAITQALANMDYPHQWKTPDSQPREETLLHLAARLGLVHLARFLIHQPRGQRTLTLPNEEGHTPLQLAQKDGQHDMFRMLAAPPGPGVSPVPAVCCVWSDSSSMLRYSPGTDSLTLTVHQASGCCPQDVVVALRDRLGDHSIIKLVRSNRLDLKPIMSSNLHSLSSPSLVALEVDSEEESTEPKSPLSPISSDVEKSEDKKETFRPSPDLTCTRSQSASACEPTSDELGDQGIRLRSYSYSSSKISLRPARFARDNHTSDISSEQRASSISDQPHEKREIKFRQRAQSADDEGSMELAESLQHLTLSEFLKEIEEEELDKYSIPTKAESEKYKVIRTFSFLKSRMSSTRNKTKGKGKDREAKDRQLNGHRFATGSCLGPTVCVVCDKPASGKDLLHCSSCTAIVHKGCKDSLPPCLKKLQDKYAVTMVKTRTASLPQNFTVRDSSPQSIIPVSTSLPVMTPKERKDAVTQPSSLSGSFPNIITISSETESDAVKPTSQSEELLSTPVSSTSTDSSFGEDSVDSYIHSDISADSVDYQAESWSLTVEHKFCKKQDKRAVKRQDVIYELMQTELHHLQTLHIMAEVFRRGMKEEVQLDAEAVERVFPRLDQLLLFHHGFFAALKERRHNSAQPLGHRNYLIQRIGDVLLQQFSEENGEKMKQVYGEFCSRHNEAVNFFKELQQCNKRFQSFIKQLGSNSLVRRREIPACILLVTQRITKYPVLLERILQHTQEETEEHKDLSKALAQIREVIAAVDLRVSKYEQHQRLKEVWHRIENRSSAKLKNGHTFRKQDMMRPGQELKHQGLLLWKTATGRLKDVLALLLTDTLIFLQEKDQKYTFATVDQKPPVIALQKLIVREVANEERGMFLISASAAGPEMYEVHTSSKEERNTWMRLIREAVERCVHEEEEYTSESEEEKRAAEARFQKILKLQESLTIQDQQICSNLEEKLQIYAELSALNGRTDASLVEPRLLVQPHSEELPQAAVLLAAALQEAENLKATLSSKACSPSSDTQDSDTDSMFPLSPATLVEPTAESPEASPDNPESSEPEWDPLFRQEDVVVLTHKKLGPPVEPDHNVHHVLPFKLDAPVVRKVVELLHFLPLCQAAVTIQDSWYEVQKLLLQESGRPSPRAQRPHLPSLRVNTLQEQEKQRNLEKRKEEVAAAQRLKDRLRQDKERWERECQARESQQEEQEIRLEEREKQCQLAAEKLKREREELDEQLEEYQLSLERLREGQRSVERERERLENQQKLLQTWKHGRQSSLPAVIPHMVIPLDEQQVGRGWEHKDHAGNGSVFVNEAAFGSSSINNRHIHHKRNDPSAHNCLNSLLARSNSRQPPIAKTPHSQHSDSQGWVPCLSFHSTTTASPVLPPTSHLHQQQARAPRLPKERKINGFSIYRLAGQTTACESQFTGDG
uniref:Rho guanine nucleotide exchange factor (GEF) 28a n=1 Tax=Acanthochromis polyacanthus TaxID=80966 RepID=A0A3Q1EM94_9TELE